MRRSFYCLTVFVINCGPIETTDRPRPLETKASAQPCAPSRDELAARDEVPSSESDEADEPEETSEGGSAARASMEASYAAQPPIPSRDGCLPVRCWRLQGSCSCWTGADMAKYHWTEVSSCSAITPENSCGIESELDFACTCGLTTTVPTVWVKSCATTTLFTNPGCKVATSEYVTASTPAPTGATSTPATSPTTSPCASATPTSASSGCSANLNVNGAYASQERNANDGKDYAQPVNLVQSGSSISGWYRGTKGMLGTFDGTLSGCTVTGTWHQEGASGPYQFVFTSVGEKFTGGWDYEGSTTPQRWSWTGTRTSTTADAKPSGSGSSSGCRANSDCGSCERCELSTGKCLTKLTCN